MCISVAIHVILERETFIILIYMHVYFQIYRNLFYMTVIIIFDSGSTEPATASTTVPQTTQSLITSTTRETSTTTTPDSGCVCTPSQCATMLPDIENFVQQNQTNHGFKTSYTLNSLLFLAMILLSLLCIS